MSIFIKKIILNQFFVLRRPIRSLQFALRRLIIGFLGLVHLKALSIAEYSGTQDVSSTEDFDVILLRKARIVNPQPLPLATSSIHQEKLHLLNEAYLTSPQYIVALREGALLAVTSYSYQRSGGHIFAIGLAKGPIIKDLSFDIFGADAHIGLYYPAKHDAVHYTCPSIIVFEPQAPTYAHWLVEMLPRLMMTIAHLEKSALNIHSYHWFISGSRFDWELEALSLLGLAVENVTFVSGYFSATFQDALIPSFVSKGAVNPCPVLVRQFLDNLKSSLDSACSSHADIPLRHCGQMPNVSSKIYLTRSGEAFRNVTNEQDVIDALEPMGFSAIDPRTLSFQSKVKIFSKCNILVGALSSGMSHSIFMSPGTLVINILPLGYFPPAEARINRSVGIKQIILPVLPTLDSRSRYADMEIDIDALVDCINQHSVHS